MTTDRPRSRVLPRVLLRALRAVWRGISVGLAAIAPSGGGGDDPRTTRPVQRQRDVPH